jgi:putative SOS response-associated peptidase YedK
MCGRFTLKASAKNLADLFQLTVVAEIAPRYNIPPSAQVLAVRERPETSRRELVCLRWGLIPSWADDPATGLINARSESAAEKSAFREAFRRRRCLVPADGFYEWKKTDSTKEPYYICLADGRPFAFAGLWESWLDRVGKPIESCAILTTNANEVVRPLHDRMPVILDERDYGSWLDPHQDKPEALQTLMRPYSGSDLIAYQVSRLVNSPKNDTPACLERAAPAPPPPPPAEERQQLLF